MPRRGLWVVLGVSSCAGRASGGVTRTFWSPNGNVVADANGLSTMSAFRVVVDCTGVVSESCFGPCVASTAAPTAATATTGVAG